MKLSLTIALSGLVLLTACVPVKNNLYQTSAFVPQGTNPSASDPVRKNDPNQKGYAGMSATQLEKKCNNQSDGIACTELGIRFEFGIEVKPSISKAKNFMKVAVS